MNRESIKRKINLSLIAQLGPLTTFMVIFFGIPIFVFFLYSLWAVEGWNIVRRWNLNNYFLAIVTPMYRLLILRSILIGLLTGALSVIVVYPLAYTLAFKIRKYRDLILFILMISLFSNYLVRIYAWRSILSSNGLVSVILMALGLAKQPNSYLLYNWTGVVVTLLNVYLPFATLPIYSALLNIEQSVVEAARDLGASPFRAFYEVTLPLSASGVKVAFLFIFLLTAGDFVTPELIGGSGGRMIGNAIATQFGIVYNWPLGSALAFTTILAIFLLIMGFLFAGCLLRHRR
jgi:spermidine/putrescine transport system permease protein